MRYKKPLSTILAVALLSSSMAIATNTAMADEPAHMVSTTVEASAVNRLFAFWCVRAKELHHVQH